MKFFTKNCEKCLSTFRDFSQKITPCIFLRSRACLNRYFIAVTFQRMLPKHIWSTVRLITIIGCKCYVVAFQLPTDLDELCLRLLLYELITFWAKLCQAQGSRIRQQIRIDILPLLPCSKWFHSIQHIVSAGLASPLHTCSGVFIFLVSLLHSSCTWIFNTIFRNSHTFA